MRQFDRRDAALVLLLILAAALVFYIAFLPAAPCAGCNAKMYVFTSDVVARELGDAVKRGVRVRVIMEPRVTDSRKQKMFDTLSALGCEVRWASFSYKLTHSKFIVVDGKRALVGSINFSESALNYNREAAVEIDGEKVKEIADAFETDWGMASSVAASGGEAAAGE